MTRPDRRRGHPPARHQREVDRRVDPRRSRASAGNKYTFAVHRDANKIQIKAAIEELYAKEKVTVVSVNVLTTKPKEKRRGTKRGRIIGWTTPWRKAIVTLAPGQKIEFFEGV